MLIHLDGIERQLDALDAQLEQIAAAERWAGQVQALTRFRGISTLTALGLIAEIGDFARLGPARAGVVAGHHPERVLLGRSAASRPHHQGRQPPRPPAARRGRLALPPRTAAPRNGRAT
jgi:hypothetical protein